jgi:tetratricopeptide (TPR) repeat protein
MIRAMIDDLPPLAPARPDPAPLLHHLIAVGLITEERNEPEDENPALTSHELVRERIRAWMHDYPQDHDGLSENSIRLGYAARLAAAFNALENRNMTAALQAGRRALVYRIQAGDYDQLSVFASGIVTNTSDPRLLAGLLPHLEAAAESAPEGELRWRCLLFLADALSRAGRPDASLPFYEQAAAQAHTAAQENTHQALADFGIITGNWAIALVMTGDLDAARQRQLESAEASKKAGRRAVNVIVSELEVLRIDIMQGQSAEALPQVEERLAKVESWWRQSRAGQRVPEAPDPGFLASALMGALDIARGAHFAQKDWESVLRRIDVMLEVERAMERPAEDIAGVRMNRAVALGRLGRFGEAQAELEACLQVFQHDPASSARVLGSLAELFDKQGDVAQAITQERRALALFEQLPNPDDCAASHNNLAIYLELSSVPSALAESQRHQLAALVYKLVVGLDLQDSLGKYSFDFRRAHAADAPLFVPRIAELLADTAFRPLDDWLRRRQVDVDELQAAVDQFLEMAWQATLEQE